MHRSQKENFNCVSPKRRTECGLSNEGRFGFRLIRNFSKRQEEAVKFGDAVSRNVSIYCTHCSRQAHTKNDTERFRNGLVRELKEKQTKQSRHSMTSNTHRRNKKQEYQECTRKMDKSLKRGMCIKFESRKICIAGDQCDNSDLDIHNAKTRSCLCS